MKISELKAKQGKVDIVVEIKDLAESREFTKFGKSGKVANATAKDDSGEIKLSLWNEQVDMVKPGTKVHIKNGYVSEWQGELQLTTGRFGTFEIVEGGVDVKAKKEDKKKKIEKDYEEDEWEEISDEDIEKDAKSKKIIDEEVSDE
ncbi:MAG: SOSS complex subunit B family protein [Nanoarchaeota archaeon]|nr:SOSS complex subunit B family protein [Nanoarchaeota archaeon]